MEDKDLFIDDRPLDMEEFMASHSKEEIKEMYQEMKQNLTRKKSENKKSESE